MKDRDPISKETVEVPGVTGLLDKYWGDGKEVIYYCRICESKPPCDESTQVAVSLCHDDCVRERAKTATAALIHLTDELDAKIGAQLNDIANTTLLIDPDAEI